MRDARVVRHEICDAGLDVQPADDFAGASFEHLDDRSLRPAPVSGPFHTHGYAIAMHHLAHLLGGEKHRRRAVVRQQQPSPLRFALTVPTDEPRQLFAQAVLAAPVDHHFARAHQRIEQLLGLRSARRSER